MQWLLDVLVIVFGISSWVAVNGLWVEMPLLVSRLPEAWQLGSYVVVAVQLGNLGPVAYAAARRVWTQEVVEAPSIHASLAVGTLSCALLSLLWDRTSWVGGRPHSTALLALVTSLALVDCSSSVLHLPFVAQFRPRRLVVSYLVGAGLSGPLPGLLALGQGADPPRCGNGTEAAEPHARFPPGAFFAALCGQMVLGWIAFVMLERLPMARKERVDLAAPPVDECEGEQEEVALRGGRTLTDFKFFTLLGLQCFVCTMHNGILLSIQTYSCLPYGISAFHLAVTLSSFANPACCVCALFCRASRLPSVAALACFEAAWAAYILTTALRPPFVGTVTLGPALVVCAWVLESGSAAFLKACIADVLRRQGRPSSLFWCGTATQLGSAQGALLAFCLIHYTHIFHESPTAC